MERSPAVYMMASGQHGAIYIGVTSGLIRRVYEHREGLTGGFTRDYGCKRLVWFEMCSSMEGAIRREKSLKRWPRQWKCNLIERENRLCRTCIRCSPTGRPCRCILTSPLLPIRHPRHKA